MPRDVFISVLSHCTSIIRYIILILEVKQFILYIVGKYKKDMLDKTHLPKHLIHLPHDFKKKTSHMVYV